MNKSVYTSYITAFISFVFLVNTYQPSSMVPEEAKQLEWCVSFILFATSSMCALARRGQQLDMCCFVFNRNHDVSWLTPQCFEDKARGGSGHPRNHDFV